MATPEDWTIVQESLSPLCEPLYRCADRAHEIADDHFIQWDMDDVEYPGGRAHLARHHLRRELKKAKDLGEWGLCHPRPNGEVTLNLSAMKLRMLRPGPTLSAKIPPPPPGLNKARISYYLNPETSLFGAAGSNLIGIWAFDTDLEEIVIRVVRPLGIWRVGRYEKIDIDFLLPRQGTALSNMQFTPSDEEIMLPIEQAEEGEEDADSTDG